ncbi:MAG TPA: GlsB/YeaQ/YmgE family stress response membrane protein [Deltaproteobacteria bacterium]|nr:GlsB/YeaQ/YmgE family stress response membrane protein [Deltaproteobacteria bacterium]
MGLLWFILIGLAAGWLAGRLMRGSSFGAVGDLAVGVVGALIGGFLFRTLGVSTGGGLLGSLIVATIGAVVLLYLLRLIDRR